MKTSSGTTYQSHQESTWGAAQARKDWWSWFRLLERAVLLGNAGVFVEHIYKVGVLFLFLFLFFLSNTVLGEKTSEVDQPCGAGSNLHGYRPPHWAAAGQKEDYNLNASCLVSFGFCS